MARRYYRSRVRYVKPRKRWASNIAKDPFRFPVTLQTGTPRGLPVYYGSASVLVANSVQNSSPTPTIIKTGNFKIQGNFQQLASASVSDNTYACTLYIMYVPQGFDISDANVMRSLVADHPEWIMAWSLLDTNATNSSSTTALTKFSCSSRLKRNLNSGDRICAIFLASLTYMGSSETATSTQTVTLSGDLECHYWTCSN